MARKTKRRRAPKSVPTAVINWLKRSNPAFKRARNVRVKKLRGAVNIAAGFVDDEGIFHPIRASHDYSAKGAGEGKRRAPKRKSRSKK